jgi:hypothetical protein
MSSATVTITKKKGVLAVLSGRGAVRHGWQVWPCPPEGSIGFDVSSWIAGSSAKTQYVVMMEGIPITRHPAPPEQVEGIRTAVRGAEMLRDSRLARPEDADGLHALFAEPKVNAPIYSLPRPLNVENVRKFIEDHIAQRERGGGAAFRAGCRRRPDHGLLRYPDLA